MDHFIELTIEMALLVTPGSRSDSIGGSEPKFGARYYLYYILYTGTLIDLFFLRAVPVPVGIQTISVITKIILHIQRTTTGVVSITIYTHIQSPIYLYMYNFYYKTSEIAEAALVSTYL